MDDKTFTDSQDAQSWIELVEQSGGLREKDIYPRLNAWVKETGAKSVLEVGAGQGACSARIDRSHCHYTGVEPHPVLLARAQEVHASDSQRFVAGNAYAIPLPDQSFDAVFSVAVWHLLGDPKKAAAEMSRVLKSLGHFLIITANPEAYEAWTDLYSESTLAGARFEGKIAHEDGSQTTDVLYLHTLDEMTAALRSAKLKVRKTDTFRKDKATGEDLYLVLEGRKSV